MVMLSVDYLSGGMRNQVLMRNLWYLNLCGLGPREPVGQNSIKINEQIQVPVYYSDAFRRKSPSANLSMWELQIFFITFYQKCGHRKGLAMLRPRIFISTSSMCISLNVQTPLFS